jgi:hypothetical protein
MPEEQPILKPIRSIAKVRESVKSALGVNDEAFDSSIGVDHKGNLHVTHIVSVDLREAARRLLNWEIEAERTPLSGPFVSLHGEGRRTAMRELLRHVSFRIRKDTGKSLTVFFPFPLEASPHEVHIVQKLEPGDIRELRGYAKGLEPLLLFPTETITTKRGQRSMSLHKKRREVLRRRMNSLLMLLGARHRASA